jgi:hypothetical protein
MKKVLLVLVATLCGVGVVSTSASAATGYGRVGAFAEAFPDGQGAHQNRIAVNHASGDVYVTDVVNDQIVVYRPNGTGADPLTTFAAGDVTDPFGIAVDQATGDVYVSDDDDVVKYTSDGALTPTFTKDNTFSSPGVTGALAFEQADDELLVADASTNTVRRYSTTGAAGATFDGAAGAGSSGAFTGLQDLAVDSTGDIVVVDATGDPAADSGSVSRVERFSSAGSFEATIAADPDAATVGIRPDDDAVIVSGKQNAVYTNQNPTLQVFASDGSPLDSPQIDGSAIYSTITGIASDDGPAGQLFVATDVGHYNASFIYGYTSVQVYGRFQLASVSIGAASSITGGSAQLNGTINPEGAATTYRFEVSADGETTWTPLDPDGDGDESAGAGTSDVAVSEVYDGLNPASSYRFRIVATRASLAVTSADAAFTTSAVLPRASTAGPGSITSASAVVGGSIDARYSATTYYIEYGPDAGYGTSAPTSRDADAGDGGSAIRVSRTLTGLAPATTYHYRIVARNAAGAATGADRTFITLAAAGTGSSEGCANAAVIAQQGVGRLPDCRAYEQTTPRAKAMSEPTPNFGARQVAEAGDAVVYPSSRPVTAGGAGSPFSVVELARRSQDGWTSRNITPASGIHLPLNGSGNFSAFSPDLAEAIVNNDRPALTDNAAPDLENIYLAHLTTPTTYDLLTTLAEPGYAPFAYQPTFVDADPGFRHVLFTVPAVLTPNAPAGVTNLYESEAGRVSLVGILPDGSVGAGGAYGGGAPIAQQNSISEDGRRVFFTDAASGRLYERIDGTSTVEISASQRSTPDPQGPQPAVFRSATPDGSAVFFTSAEKLTDDATTDATVNGAGDLYRFDTASGELTDLTVDASGTTDGGARVKGVVGNSEDGATVYFVAGSATLTGDGTDGAANLFVRRAGVTRFIGGLSTDTFKNDDGYYQVGMGQPNVPVSRDGRHLVIASYAALTGAVAAGTREVYLYDAVADGISCLSCPLGDASPAGDATVQLGDGQGPTVGAPRAMTDDGSRVFFTSPEALVPGDVNHLADVYQYVVASGKVELLSSGHGPYESTYLGASADGSDVFFFTRNQLVATDDDDFVDVYDASSGGGFLQPSPPVPCTGDQCQGAAVVPQAPSRSATGDEHASDPAPLPRTLKLKPSAKTITGTSGLLSVTVPGAGRVAVSGKAIATVKLTVLKAGTYRIRIHLRSASIKSLKRHGKLTVTVGASFAGSESTHARGSGRMAFRRPAKKKHATSTANTVKSGRTL